MLLIENVTVRFGGVTALDDFSAQVSDGEICGFIGPNGAGKTTLFNCCTRVVRPASGRIAFDGHDLLAEPEAMAKIGYSPKLTVQASNCGSTSLMFAPAGAAANGQKLVFWEKDPGNPIYANDPGYTAYVANAKKVDPAHAQPANTYYETGWMIADMDINAFQAAAKSSLGLSEVGIMQAARNQNSQPPLFINGSGGS